MVEFRIGVSFGGNDLNTRDWFAANWLNIVLGLIALIVISTTGAMVLMSRPIPDLWGTIVVTVIAFFFGVQVPRPAAAAARDLQASVQAVQAARDISTDG